MPYFSLVRFFLYLVPLSVVVVAHSTLFPFIVGKYVFFRTAVGLALISFLLGVIFRPEEIWKKLSTSRVREVVRSPLTIAVLVFVAVFLLATALSVDPATSFWSNFERGEGGLQLLFLGVYFLLLIAAFDAEKHWKTLCAVSLAAATVVIVYGILAQIYPAGPFIGPYTNTPAELIPASAWSRVVSERIHGTIGNPAYVAVYLIFIELFSFFLFLKEKGRAKKRLLAAAMVFFGIGFWLAQTRGAFLGLLAGLGAALIYFVVVSKKWRGRGLGIIGAVTALVILGFVFRETPLVRNIPGSRLFDIGLGERTAKTRLWTWNAAVEGWRERPLFGWGPENFSLVFDKHFDTRHYVPNVRSETWFDRAHSVIFDYLAETGILGLLAFLGIFVAYGFLVVKQMKKDREALAKNAVLHAALVAMPVAYLVQGLLLFDILPTYINLFTLFAFVQYVFNKDTH